jgi:hypothetical protein
MYLYVGRHFLAFNGSLPSTDYQRLTLATPWFIYPDGQLRNYLHNNKPCGTQSIGFVYKPVVILRVELSYVLSLRKNQT